MNRFYLIIIMVFVGVSAFCSQHANVVWNTPSRNSSESMPCGGGDIGMNIWVEEGDLLFYVSRSGTFDENNCQLKQGRFRIRLSPNPLKDAKDFRQELKLKDGYVEVSAGGTRIQLWADIFHPVVHVEITNAQPLQTKVSYENWRYKERMIRKGEGQQCSYKWAPPKGTVTNADFVSLSSKKELPGMTEERNLLLFYHRNPEQTVFDIAVAQQGMENVESQMMNPLKDLTFGGYLFGIYGYNRQYLCRYRLPCLELPLFKGFSERTILHRSAHRPDGNGRSMGTRLKNYFAKDCPTGKDIIKNCITRQKADPRMVELLLATQLY